MKRIILLTLLFLCLSAFSDAATCPTGTAASYADTVCQQPPVHMYWPPDTFKFTGTNMPNIAASDVFLRQDKQCAKCPPDPYTILVGAPQLVMLKRGQIADLSLTFFMSGTGTIAGWPHGNAPNGSCTGDISLSMTAYTADGVFVSQAKCGDKNVPRSFPIQPAMVVVKIHAVGPASLQSYGIHP